MAKTQKKQEISLLLHNIRSIHNVGSIFRTADAAGVATIYLTGYTPKPVDRFGRPVKELAKVALGGEHSVAWEAHVDPVQLITDMRVRSPGLIVVGIEQDKKSVDYKNVDVHNKPVLFVVGNEVEGIDAEILEHCDIIAEIPMKGTKESLNVAVTTGIALFRMLGV